MNPLSRDVPIGATRRPSAIQPTTCLQPPESRLRSLTASLRHPPRSAVPPLTHRHVGSLSQHHGSLPTRPVRSAPPHSCSRAIPQHAPSGCSRTTGVIMDDTAPDGASHSGGSFPQRDGLQPSSLITRGCAKLLLSRKLNARAMPGLLTGAYQGCTRSVALGRQDCFDSSVTS